MSDTTDMPDPEIERSSVALRTLGELILGIVLGALILWVLVVSVNDIQFVYQGF